MENKTLGKHCKDRGVTLTILVEKSGVQKGTLESRWKLGKEKEINCLIDGVNLEELRRVVEGAEYDYNAEVGAYLPLVEIEKIIK